MKNPSNMKFKHRFYCLFRIIESFSFIKIIVFSWPYQRAFRVQALLPDILNSNKHVSLSFMFYFNYHKVCGHFKWIIWTLSVSIYEWDKKEKKKEKKACCFRLKMTLSDITFVDYKTTSIRQRLPNNSIENISMNKYFYCYVYLNSFILFVINPKYF